MDITPASHTLRALAARLAQPYAALPQCRAIILTGSAAEGVSDYYSDLDVILYYDQLPPEADLLAASVTNGAANRSPIVPRSDEAFLEHYWVDGVECQFAHSTVAEWEAEMKAVLGDLDVTSPIQKALGGMEEAIPLYGEPLMRQWQAHLVNYPDALAEAMVRQNLAFYPLWALLERLETRDGTIWVTQMKVDNAHALLGTLAGLNRVYFSSFQFKRTRHFAEKLAIAPPNFADRLEAAFHAEVAEAAAILHALVTETVDLVEAYMPQIDTSWARRGLARRDAGWGRNE
jgi:hypothetical protein